VTNPSEMCKACRWAEMANAGNPEQGLCRRYPPTDENRWPEVLATDWCGEHQPIVGYHG
jgi:hypothetical protein